MATLSSIRIVLAVTVLVLADSDAHSAPRVALGHLGLVPEENAKVSDLVVAGFRDVGVEFVERQQMALLMKEMQASAEGRIAPKEAIRIGEILKADWLVLGSKGRSTNETLFVRVVESGSGQVKNFGFISAQTNASALSAQIGDLLRGALDKKEATNRTYLAVGAFEDVGVGRQLANLPEELRRYLIASYQGTGVQTVERDQVDWLLDELRMNIAGISTRATNDAPNNSVWALDGKYQWFDGDTPQVDMILFVQRIGGARKEVRFKLPTGEPTFTRIKTELDQGMRREGAAQTHASEVQVLIDRAKELARMKIIFKSEKPSHLYATDARNTDRQKQIDNSEEAIKALKGALLLDPDNFEAKIFLMYLNTGFPGGYIRREEATNWAREAVGNAPSVEWADFARKQLVEMINYQQNPDGMKDLDRLQTETQNPELLAKIDEVRTGLLEALAESGKMSREEFAPHAEKALFNELAKMYEVTAKWTDPYHPNLNSLSFAWRNEEKAAAHLNRILPELRKRFPRWDKKLLSQSIYLQVNSSSAPMVEAGTILENAHSKNDKITDDERIEIAGLFAGPLRGWAFRRQDYDLFLKLYAATESLGIEGALGDADKVCFYFALEAKGRTDDALAILDGLGNRTMQMGTDGPWGDFRKVFIPAKVAAERRRQLGKSGSQQLTLDAGEVILRGPTFFNLTRDGEVLWATTGNLLYKGSIGSFSTAKPIKLPIKAEQYVRSPVCTATTVFIAGNGEGLIAYDKKSGEIKQYREKDGLLSDAVISLRLDGGKLWIGYGTPYVGGLGWMDLVSGKFGSYTPDLPKEAASLATFKNQAAMDPKDGPPRRAITSIAQLKDKLWIGVWKKGVQSYDLKQRKWETFEVSDVGQSTAVVVATDDYIAIGCEEAQSWAAVPGGEVRLGGLTLFDKNKNSWEHITTNEGLPRNEVRSLFIDGKDLWIGGYGFLCRMDLPSRKIKEVMPTEWRVWQVLLVDDAIWAAIGDGLHRINRPKTAR